MRNSPSPSLTDWLVISLRWLTILGLTVSLSLHGSLGNAPILLLLGLAAWNIGLSLMTGADRCRPRHRAQHLLGRMSVFLDLVVALSLFWQQRGFSGPAYWAGLLPIFTAAVSFQPGSALIIALLVSLAEVGLAWLLLPSLATLPVAGIAAVALLIIALLLGFLGRGLTKNRPPVQPETPQKVKIGVESGRLRAVSNMISTLTSTLNYKRVIDSVLDLSLSALNSDPDDQPDDRLIGAVLMFSKEESLEVASARRFTPADLGIILPGAEGAFARAIEDGNPVLVTKVAEDAELNRIVALRVCSQVYCFPLRSGFSVYGVLIFGHPEPDYFTADRMEVLDILGQQTVIAIQNARLYQDLANERDRIIEAQEEARKKLARDLHDGPTQSVAAIAMRVNMAQRTMVKDPKAAYAQHLIGQELSHIEELARRTTKEIRHMLFTLRPLALESQGLVAALQAMADKMKETFSQNVIVNVDEGLLDQLEMGKQGVIFYIVEEAVNNARKHAKAANIWVRLRSLEEGLTLLEIQDDGVGFDVEAVNRSYDNRGSLGMVNLRERSELVNGLLHIQSAPGKGTRVQVYLPLTEEVADRLHHAAGVG
ncbi:MAG: GAF domain-containing sensor histidine kinase [Anaerolineales bacterium]|nr:GAF domain-containing sensor histidine kinase [Anaerolineales bacterium]